KDIRRSHQLLGNLISHEEREARIGFFQIVITQHLKRQVDLRARWVEQRVERFLSNAEAGDAHRQHACRTPDKKRQWRITSFSITEEAFDTLLNPTRAK